MTEGVFASMILDDPELTGIAAVLFDEFHERSLDADFGLALALDVAGALRPDLRLLVMSATLDAVRVATLLGDAPVIESAGRAYPVDIRYRPRKADERIEAAMVSAIRAALAEEEGSILAFLPGQAEIRRVEERLREAIPPSLAEGLAIIPLHGGLDGRQQDAAIRPAPEGRRKVVLATSIAETSVTIDGVRVVIDSGLARVPKYEPGSGVTRLETVRASRAGVDQRAGRAGRTRPGVAIRLWPEPQTAALPAHGTPEIMEADLSGLLLDSAAFGVTDPRTLDFLDAPPEPALNEARKLLRMLGALDDVGGGLTRTGKAMRRLALPARLSFMVVAAAAKGQGQAAARLAVLLTERGLGGMATDVERRLSAFERDPSPRAKAARALADRLARNAGGGGSDRGDASLGELLLLAFPDRLARRRGGHGRYVLANGRGAALDETDPLAGEEWLVVADLTGQARQGRILAAAPLDETTVRAAMANRIEMRTEASFDRESGRLRGRKTVAIGAITLDEQPLRIVAGPEADAALLSAIRQAGLDALPFADRTRSLLDRLRWLHETLGEPWPAMDEEALLDSLDEWLGPFLDGSGRLDAVGPRLADALRSRVPFDRHRQIEEQAPTHFTAPTGNAVPIRYDREQGPVLAIRVQELFGLKNHPTIGGQPLTLELLSPAHRPIQTTADLPGFWAGSWADVRADMRGRYPKHEWPEDPASAAPTARAKRRK